MGGSCLDVVLWSLSSLRIFTTIYNLSLAALLGQAMATQCPRSDLNINIMIHWVGEGGWLVVGVEKDVVGTWHTSQLALMCILLQMCQCNELSQHITI